MLGEGEVGTLLDLRRAVGRPAVAGVEGVGAVVAVEHPQMGADVARFRQPSLGGGQESMADAD